MALWNNHLPSRRNERSLSSFTGIDDLFDQFRREFLSPDFLNVGDINFMPKVEIKESDKNIFVCAELPGIKEKDINVTLKENNLIIEGEKRTERKQEEKGYFKSEFSYGSFYRAIPLHAEVDADKVEASYKNGILEVNLIKLEESKQTAKKIAIKH